MASTNKTSRGLSQFMGNDRLKRDDYNNDMKKIDNELNGLDQNKEPKISKKTAFNLDKATDYTSFSEEELASMDVINALMLFLKQYSDANTAGILDAAPATLDTLNELARALGDDPNFATTITNLIATKLNANAQAVDSAKLGGQSRTSGLVGNTVVGRDALGNTTVNAIYTNYVVLNGYTITVV
ncbi:MULTISPECIES: hypothetical protein [Psychrilyobacter]|uniref:Phage tail protein n=1 Tax=Psychrilyobacter piezotolerans TaxID=2293438 RepID=A0ABX9KIL8_9FUSO|nr:MULTISPECIES: hypothetical protein [Psychrilyobacter]MCS5420779.1 hypothetical protein [Psychrilyobacter sp. S5]NDI77427.1 hypothetical protein [Psychrilyobacter piezotolerans]RDE63730.1 hypothetical protein DV867_04970 [Psychrilyobacter sp. S5]REI42074.1 hypothetical protein DYH56_04970 [Psychrilyobacter piezotolerans]